MLYFMQNVPYFARFYLFLCVFSSFTFLFLRGKTQALYSLSGKSPPQNAIVNGFRGQKKSGRKNFFSAAFDAAVLRRILSEKAKRGVKEKRTLFETEFVFLGFSANELVEELFVSFAEFQNGFLGSRNFNGFFRLRVDARFRGYVFDFKRTETNELNLFAVLQSFRDRIDQSVVRDLRVFAREACLRSYCFNEFAFVHKIKSPLGIFIPVRSGAATVFRNAFPNRYFDNNIFYSVCQALNAKKSCKMRRKSKKFLIFHIGKRQKYPAFLSFPIGEKPHFISRLFAAAM